MSYRRSRNFVAQVDTQPLPEDSLRDWARRRFLAEAMEISFIYFSDISLSSKIQIRFNISSPQDGISLSKFPMVLSAPALSVVCGIIYLCADETNQAGRT